MVVNGKKKKKKKTTIKMGQEKLRMKYPTWVYPYTEKKTVVPSGTFPSFQVNRAYISKTNLHIILGNPKS